MQHGGNETAQSLEWKQEDSHPYSVDLESGVVLQTTSILCSRVATYCAFYGKSVKFCTVIPYTTKVILRSGPILNVACGDLGGHFVFFEFCPLKRMTVAVSPSISKIISV